MTSRRRIKAVRRAKTHLYPAAFGFAIANDPRQIVRVFASPQNSRRAKGDNARFGGVRCQTRIDMHRRTPLPLSGGWRSGETSAWSMAEEGFRTAGEFSRDEPTWAMSILV